MGLDEAGRYTRYVSWFDRSQRAALYAPEFERALHDRPERLIAQTWTQASGASVIDRMLEVDVQTYLQGDLIPKMDIATMAFGLEGRSPLLDHELMEFAATIPAALKLRGREKKWILREALRGRLPDDILDRPKQGFSVPLSSWLRADLHAWSRDILLDPVTLARGYFQPAGVRRLLDRHDAGVDACSKQIWALLMLELWHREFVDGESAGALPGVGRRTAAGATTVI
jgi:asparagine synthase (glutamine-hydrolysing)